MNELVSVIIPIYNVEKYLTRCLESVIKQTYKNLEIILVNDGSTDNSKYICDKYSKSDGRIVLINKINGGLSSARNSGLDIMKGEYFTFLDSDDWIAKDYIEKLVSNITDFDIIQCGYKRINQENKVLFRSNCINKVLNSSEEILEAFFINQDFNTMAWGKLYSKKSLGNIRFLVNKNNEDTIYIADCLKKIIKVRIIEGDLYFYYFNDQSIMNSKINSKKIEDAYYSANYMVHFCETTAPHYVKYMHRNICEISISLYEQLNIKSEKYRQLKSVIVKNFNISFFAIKFTLLKMNIPLLNKIKIYTFFVSKKLTIYVYHLLKERRKY